MVAVLGLLDGICGDLGGFFFLIVLAFQLVSSFRFQVWIFVGSVFDSFSLKRV